MLAVGDRVIMVSGASRGIGRAIAQRLRRDGYRLSLGARRRQDLAALTGDEVLIHAYEASNRASAEAWVAATHERFGRIDGLINNAGMLRDASLDDPDDAFEQLWQVNAMGPLRLIRAALPHLRAAGNGRVVNVVSLSGKRVANDNAGYAMSKFAALALSHATRRAGWGDGVRVTALCPSFVATDMTAAVGSVRPEDMIQPEDLAALVATVLALPATAQVAELLVNCRLEPMF